jgi:hypothetical protein
VASEQDHARRQTELTKIPLLVHGCEAERIDMFRISSTRDG